MPPKADMCGATSDVRFGSEVDICGAKAHVRFALNSDSKSGLPQKVMSALTPKAHMCAATTDVGYGPKADIAVIRSTHRREREVKLEW